MGATSVIQFFSKLSQGTAQMSTSRQALRLGQRLSLGRLLGFYYTHIGYYFGQLHYYHANYLLLALAFLGLVVDTTGALPGVGLPALALFNRVFGILSLLFFAFSFLPMIFALLCDEGVVAAVTKPLRTVLTLSPLFFVMQSTSIAHYFSQEFAVGGAKYVPTGRGLAISHTPFHQVFVAYAASCIYPGVELLGLVVSVALLSFGGKYPYNLWSFGFASIPPIALLLGPSLFNPHALRSREGFNDLKLFCVWLVRPTTPGGTFDPRLSWADFHQDRADAKRKVGWRAFFLPSKELLLSLPLLLATHLVMAPYGWGLAELAILALPLHSMAAIFSLTMPFVMIYAAISHKGAMAPAMARASRVVRLELIAAVLVAATIVLEVKHWDFIQRLGYNTVPKALPRAHAMLLMATRYYSFRWTCNAGLYLAAGCKQRAIEKQDVVSTKGTSPRIANPVRRILPDAFVYAVALVGAGHLFLVDACLGFVIQLVYILLGFFPFSARIHYAILGFGRKVRSTADKLREDRSAATTLERLAQKVAAEKEADDLGELARQNESQRSMKFSYTDLNRLAVITPRGQTPRARIPLGRTPRGRIARGASRWDGVLSANAKRVPHALDTPEVTIANLS